MFGKVLLQLLNIFSSISILWSVDIFIFIVVTFYDFSLECIISSCSSSEYELCFCDVVPWVPLKQSTMHIDRKTDRQIVNDTIWVRVCSCSLPKIIKNKRSIISQKGHKNCTNLRKFLPFIWEFFFLSSSFYILLVFCSSTAAVFVDLVLWFF